ncbi:MAG: hypothetical protein FJW95_02275 [Actinobacteria bacterium]|nr:hypothetical protein [Actinomycetota bacterium]
MDRRADHLAQAIDGLLAMDVPTITVVVQSNDAAGAADSLRRRLRPSPGAPPAVRVAPRLTALFTTPMPRRSVVALQWRPGVLRRHGFYLTWGHIAVMRAALASGQYSHFVYLEDDIGFTQENLDYWCRYRSHLASAGLLPGFVRFEEKADERFVIDLKQPVPRAHPRRHVECGEEGTRTFLVMPNPYQAMYVVDRPLAAEHFRFSPARSPFTSLGARGGGWGVRERAAMGPIFDDVPRGLHARNAVLERAEPTGPQLHPGCMIGHLAGGYVDEPQFGLPVVRMAETFVP